MLPAAHRMRASADFGVALRAGRQVRLPRVVVHLLPPPVVGRSSGPARVGFVVSRRVGNAVVRNVVKRRLRSVLRTVLPVLPAGTLVVVRALPPAAEAGYAELASDVERAVRQALDPGRRRHRCGPGPRSSASLSASSG